MKGSLISAEPSGPALPGGISGLRELSRNLWWSWDPEATRLWDDVADRLGVAAGERTPRNPVRWLLRAKRGALHRLAADRGFRFRLESVVARFRRVLADRRSALPGLGLDGPVAYFSMEFGVHESVPIYAGGLGILAGDHAKTASDLGLPLVGVSLYYRRGYFRQGLDSRGRQTVTFPAADPAELPLDALADKRGRELRIRVELPGRTVRLRAWRMAVGRVNLILLDSDVPENTPRDRTLTHRLYIGDREARITQEILCGIGGVRALRALGIRPSLWHLNEGHVAFLTLERIRELTAEGLSFSAAVEAVAGDCVFTTHTPVPEGNEVFKLDLARRHLAVHCEAAGIPVEDYLRLGLDRGGDGHPIFSMTVLGIHLSRQRNGVSRLHGEVSRRMWVHLWPGLPADRIPITSVTNGVHTETWVAPEYHQLYRRLLGERWPERLLDAGFWRRARQLPAGELWAIKRALKVRMIRFVRERVYRRLVANGQSSAAARRSADSLLDPDAFTIGFSRRFALYKRAGLLFQHPRAKKLFTDRQRPVQIIFAGKPHPEDALGAKLFEEIAALSRRPEFAGKVVLLENYDIEVARHLVQGVDLWLNNPRRPLEASGTSGQKVPINCGLNLSILDGWWNEGYSPAAGFAFGKPIDYPDPDRQDREDRDDLYRVLTREVLPLYFERGREGIPRGWMEKVKSAMAFLVPRFSSAQMVADYARQLYRPASAGGRRLRAGRGREALALAHWRERVQRSWPFAHVVRASRTAGGRRAEVEIFTSALSPSELSAEVAVDGSSQEAVKGREVRLGVVRYTFRLPRHAPVRLRVWPRHAALPHPPGVGACLEAEV